MRELEERYGSAIAIVGVHSGKFITERITSRIRDASIRLGATHPIVNDRQFRVWRSYAVRAWPTLVAIDPAGRVTGMHAGEFTADRLADFIDGALADARPRGELDESPRHFDADAPTSQTRALTFPTKLSLGSGRIAISDVGRVTVADLSNDGRSARVTHTFTDFVEPQGLAFHDDSLFVCDARRHTVARIDLSTGEQRVVAGTGTQRRSRADAASGAIASPFDVAVVGHRLFIALAGSHQIASAGLDGSDFHIVAGSGAEELHDADGRKAALAQPMGIAADGERLWFADSESSAIRTLLVDSPCTVETQLGTGLFDFGLRDGARDTALLQHPQALAIDGDRVLVVDTYNDALRWFDRRSGQLATWLDGFHEPSAAALTPDLCYVTDTNAHQIVIVDRASDSRTPLLFDGLATR